MSDRPSRRLHAPAVIRLSLLALAALAAGGCKGDDGPAGPGGPPGPGGPTNTNLKQGDDLPGLTATIVSVTGGTGANGVFRVGDRATVNFTLKKTDASDWPITELSGGGAMISGPTFNYQRVIAEQSDLIAASVEQANGSYTYTFTAAIPATYLEPFSDTASFGPEDGELTGQALLDGTYTVGLTIGWIYRVDGQQKRATGNATFDFVLGSGTLEPREVVKLDNCNRCHGHLRVHGGSRADVKLCVLCHTAGSEDNNTNGNTPGVSIDFRVMIHKIHAGHHLPSVLGVATNPDGSRNYAATPQPYRVGDEDFSHVAFPAWPNGLVPMPRDQGYSALSSTDKATEDTIRKGPSNCIVCHGDPDGGGPLTPPAQGDLYKAQPTRQSCGSCHDDVLWGQSYTANGQTMGAQANNSNCLLCHAAQGNPLAVYEAHLHPLLDPSFDPGLNLAVTDVTEAGTHNSDGTIDPGEKIQFRLRIRNDAGVEIDPATIAAPTLLISGPTDNYNLILNTTVPTAVITGAQPYTLQVPMKVDLERLGVSTGALDTFTTDFTPHLNVSGATTSVLVRTATGGSTFLTTATAAPQNFVDVNDTTGFARDDYVVVDDGLSDEEYARIQLVDGNRLWFSSPYSTSYKAGLERAHPVNATVREVTLTTKTAGVDYTLTALTGSITELVEFGAGTTVVASYTTDFVMPAAYPLALNATPGLGDASGKWTGKPLVDGTYTLGIWSSRNLTLALFGESNSYKSTSDSNNVDFLVGSASAIDPYDLIASGTSCFNCHQELAFHGFGRRGFESCVLCHGTSGAEDRPTYIAANAPATPGLTVSFRSMLHKIHRGHELANATTYGVVGHGSGAYPDNYSVANYQHVIFPAQPGGTQNCVKCHENDAWREPKPRAHPTNQAVAIGRWTVVCGSCHDSTDAQAHIAVQTDSAGNESCGVCHGPGRNEDVQRVHKPY